MRRRQSMMPLMVSLLVAAPALADDIKNASFTPREMTHCMMKRLREHNSESYREAYKTCKQGFDAARADRSETAMSEAAPAERSK